MFTPLGLSPSGRKPPRSNGLLLFLCLMMLLATALFLRDLRKGPSLFGRQRFARPASPTPQEGPVEVIFLKEDPPEAAPLAPLPEEPATP